MPWAAARFLLKTSHWLVFRACETPGPSARISLRVLIFILNGDRITIIDGEEKYGA